MMAVEVENARFSLGPKLITIWRFSCAGGSLGARLSGANRFRKPTPADVAIAIQVQVQVQEQIVSQLLQ